jgi:lipopolysaccharide export system permease protein
MDGIWLHAEQNVGYFSTVRLLNRYILNNFVATFAITLTVVTFVMCLGALSQISDKLAHDFPWKPIATIFFSAIPMVLPFSIPISSVTTSLLVFERLSADGEISAMRACGISIWQIVSRPVLFAVLLSCICLYINTELVAKMHFLHRSTINAHKEEIVRALLTPGRFVYDIPGYAVYVRQCTSTEDPHRFKVRDIIIYDDRPGKFGQETRAGAGVIEMDETGKKMKIVLSDGIAVNPFIEGRQGPGFIRGACTNIIDLGVLAATSYRKRMADRTAGELVDDMMNAGNSAAYRMTLAVELNQRIVLSLSCLAFVLLGIPFGITTRRSSSSVGIVISLMMVFSFYLCILLVDSLAIHPAMRPDLIMWTPAIVSMALGICLLHRMR